MNQSLKILLDSVKTSPFIVYVKDIENNFLYLNEEAEPILNNSKYKNLFENDVHLLQPGEKSKSAIYFLEDLGPLQNSKCFHFIKIPVFSEEQPCLLGIGIDISSYLVEKKTLGFYQNILNSMTDSVVITEAEEPYRILYVNDAFSRLTGFKKDCIIGKTPTRLLGKDPADDKKRKKFDAKIKNFEMCEEVFTNYDINKKPYKVHLRIIPLFYTNSDKPDYFMGIQRDVTETVKSALEAKERNDKLQALYNGTTDYIWLLSPQGYVEEMNLSARVASGTETTRKQRFEKGRWWKANDNVEAEIQRFVYEIITSGKKQTKVVDFLTADDRVIKVSLTGTPHRSKLGDGSISHLVMEASDVTELERKKVKAETIARGLSSSNYDALQQWQNTKLEGEELERFVKMESAIYEDVKPKLDYLTKTISDPNEGLIVGFNGLAELVHSIDSKLGKSDSFFLTLSFLNKIPNIFQSKLFRWFIVIIISAGAINTAEDFFIILDSIVEGLRNPSEIIIQETDE